MTTPPMPPAGSPTPPEDGPGAESGFGPAQPLSFADEPAASPGASSSRHRWVVGGIVAAVLLALGVVGAWAVVGSGLLGGGAAPEERVPATAVAFAKIDLDPSLGQKLGARDFLSKFPKLRESFGQDGDLRRQLWNLAAKQEPSLAGIDYGADVEPWLGKRAAAALVPGLPGEEPQGVALLQVTDEAKAQAGIAKVLAADPQKDPAFVVRDGYAVFAETPQILDRLNSQTESGALSDDANFAADSDLLGEDGVTSGWVDLARLRGVLTSASFGGGALAQQQSALESSLTGRVTYAVRFDDDDLELVAQGSGLSNTGAFAGVSTSGIGDLPGDTLAAVSLSNGDDALRSGWSQMVDSLESTVPQVRQQISDAEAQLGLSLPDDLAVLLGDSFNLAMDRRDPAAPPRIGARVRTDSARFEEVLGKVAGAGGADLASLGIATTRFDGGIAVGRPGDYAAELARDGNLGDNAQFTAALPDLTDADIAAFADVDAIASRFSEALTDPEDRAAVEAIDSVGLTVGVDEEGTSSLRMRVVTK